MSAAFRRDHNRFQKSCRISLDAINIDVISLQYHTKPMTNTTQPVSQEINRSALSGWFMLVLTIAFFFGGPALVVRELQLTGGEPGFDWLINLGIALPILAVILMGGLFT